MSTTSILFFYQDSKEEEKGDRQKGLKVFNFAG